MENLETRVGFKTISVLNDLLKDYIVAHTKDGLYVGDVNILSIYQENAEYLRGV